MDEGRFPPGAMLGQRYRVVSLLGRGGMGEVYRANDLLVGQSVALKLLPEAWARDEAFLSRFRNEVRTARMVTHPNVCRVHDLGEADGRMYLSMEFVDGEDLGSLLRRIGRLPEDKGLEIARKLCAGLQAAHDKGVIHRDLKPANIMIDGRGEVLITDFGLAGMADSIRDVNSGTPAYMAPEQRAGREVTPRSDIYALGIVLHEIFTGRRPGASGTTTVALSPAIQSVLDRCVAEDPAARPTSAHAVARALPGGDPLAAALAAGQTPAPEVVAASGEHAGLRPAVAVLLALLALSGPLIMAWYCDWIRDYRTTSPDELRVRARDLVRQVEGSAAPHEAWALDFDTSLAPAASGDPQRISKAHYVAPRFWYRTSPIPFGSLRQQALPAVRSNDPPRTMPGMAYVEFDLRGRLVRYESVRPAREPAAASAPDWDVFLRLTGIDKARLTNHVASGEAASWDFTDDAGLHYRVDALASRGRPRLFQVSGDWERPVQPSPWPAMIEAILVALAIFFAVRNHRSGRADWKGARVLAALIFALTLASHLLRGSDLLHWHGANTPADAAGVAAVLAAIVGIAYLAMEPFVRRRWPSLLVTWTRLLHGGWRDPTVGRDVLAGMAVTAVCWMVLIGSLRLAGWKYPMPGQLVHLQSSPFVVGSLLGGLFLAVTRAVSSTFLLFLLRLVLRSTAAAAAVHVLLFMLMLAGETGDFGLPYLAVCAVVGTVQVWLLLRFGMLAKAASEVTVLAAGVVQTLDPAEWFFGYSVLSLAWLAVLVGAAFHTATAGRTLLSEE